MVEKVGRFEIIAKIGEGATGSVYRAKDPSSGRDVAVKTVRLDARLTAEARDRLMREARTIGTLSHPNIVSIFDVGEVEDSAYTAMEYVDGQDLNAVIAEGAPFRPLAILPWLDQVADALDYAHRRGVVHRDLKPSNILLARIGQIKVSDFGLAKMASMASPDGGLWVGTPRYMSPEQIRGEKVDHRSDIFSFGVVIYELLTGRHPFESDTVVSTIYKVVNEPAPAAHEGVSSVDQDVNAVLQRALDKTPDARFASARELVEGLRQSAKKSVELTPTVPLAGAGPVSAAAPGSRFCDQCGTALRASVRFCYRCGSETLPPEDADVASAGIAAESTQVLASPETASMAPLAPPPRQDTFRTNPEERLTEAAPPISLGHAPTVPEMGFDRTVTLLPEEARSPGFRPSGNVESAAASGASLSGVESRPLSNARATAPPLAGYARSSGSRELPPAGVVVDTPPARRGIADLIVPILFFLLLLGGSGLLGYWLGPRLLRKAPARNAQPAATNVASGAEQVPATDGAQTDNAQNATPAPTPPAPAAAGPFAALVVPGETRNVDGAERALGAPDGKFARIPPGGSIAVALPEGQIVRDDGTRAPDIRVTGAPGGDISYTISARSPSGSFVRIDRVRRFSTHDFNHHRVASADAFKITNTSETNAMLLDSIEVLHALEPQ